MQEFLMASAFFRFVSCGDCVERAAYCPSFLSELSDLTQDLFRWLDGKQYQVATINSDWLHSFFRIVSIFPSASLLLFSTDADFSDTPLSDCGIERLVWFFDEHITSLNIEGTQIGLRGAYSLSSFIRIGNHLRRINLANNKLVGWKEGAPDFSGIEALATAISLSQSLVSMSFSGQPGYERVEPSAPHGGAAGTPQTATIDSEMEDNDLSNKALGVAGAILLASFLVVRRPAAKTTPIEARCPSLTYLNVDKNDFREHGKKLLANALQACPELTYLRCDEWSIGDEEAIHLDVCNQGMTHGDMELLASVLENNHTLHGANILGNDLEADVLMKLRDNTVEKRNLFSLCGLQENQERADLVGKNICATDLVLLADELTPNTTLLELDLRSNVLCTQAAGEGLARVLTGNVSLTELRLSHNSAHGDTDSPGFARAFAVGLAANATLKKLDLASMHLLRGKPNGNHHKNEHENFDVDVSGIDALFVAIRRNTTLCELNVCDNNIPEETMEELIDLCTTRPALRMLCLVPFKDNTLRFLQLSKKSLHLEGALVVARYLRSNSCLLDLDVSWNWFGPDGGKAVARSLTMNRTLIRLDISHNLLKEVGTCSLERAIRYQQTRTFQNLVVNVIHGGGEWEMDQDTTTVDLADEDSR
jgi:Ran GTPase-activating protein (RanGAP) involved in mRNA processing and transport